MKKFLTGLSLIAALGFSSYGYGQEHDRTLREVAEELREDIHNNTTYIRDIDAHGVLDYWETPGETDEFDCEEGALKMAADLRNRGYNPEEARAVFGWIDVVTESSERGKYIVEEQGRDGHAWLETYELINIGDNIYYEQPTVHDWVFNISGTEEEIVRNHGIQYVKKHTYEEGDINYEQKFEEFILAFRDGKDVDKLFPEFRKKKATYIDLGSLLYPFDK